MNELAGTLMGSQTGAQYQGDPSGNNEFVSLMNTIAQFKTMADAQQQAGANPMMRSFAPTATAPTASAVSSMPLSAIRDLQAAPTPSALGDPRMIAEAQKQQRNESAMNLINQGLALLTPSYLGSLAMESLIQGKAPWNPDVYRTAWNVYEQIPLGAKLATDLIPWGASEAIGLVGLGGNGLKYFGNQGMTVARTIMENIANPAWALGRGVKSLLGKTPFPMITVKPFDSKYEAGLILEYARRSGNENVFQSLIKAKDMLAEGKTTEARTIISQIPGLLYQPQNIVKNPQSIEEVMKSLGVQFTGKGKNFSQAAVGQITEQMHRANSIVTRMRSGKATTSDLSELSEIFGLRQGAGDAHDLYKTLATNYQALLRGSIYMEKEAGKLRAFQREYMLGGRSPQGVSVSPGGDVSFSLEGKDYNIPVSPGETFFSTYSKSPQPVMSGTQRQYYDLQNAASGASPSNYPGQVFDTNVPVNSMSTFGGNQAGVSRELPFGSFASPGDPISGVPAISPLDSLIPPENTLRAVLSQTSSNPLEIGAIRTSGIIGNRIMEMGNLRSAPPPTLSLRGGMIPPEARISRGNIEELTSASHPGYTPYENPFIPGNAIEGNIPGIPQSIPIAKGKTQIPSETLPFSDIEQMLTDRELVAVNTFKANTAELFQGREGYLNDFITRLVNVSRETGIDLGQIVRKVTTIPKGSSKKEAVASLVSQIKSFDERLAAGQYQNRIASQAGFSPEEIQRGVEATMSRESSRLIPVAPITDVTEEVITQSSPIIKELSEEGVEQVLETRDKLSSLLHQSSIGVFKSKGLNVRDDYMFPIEFHQGRERVTTLGGLPSAGVKLIPSRYMKTLGAPISEGSNIFIVQKPISEAGDIPEFFIAKGKGAEAIHESGPFYDIESALTEAQSIEKNINSSTDYTQGAMNFVVPKEQVRGEKELVGTISGELGKPIAPTTQVLSKAGYGVENTHPDKIAGFVNTLYKTSEDIATHTPEQQLLKDFLHNPEKEGVKHLVRDNIIKHEQARIDKYNLNKDTENLKRLQEFIAKTPDNPNRWKVTMLEIFADLRDKYREVIANDYVRPLMEKNPKYNSVSQYISDLKTVKKEHPAYAGAQDILQIRDVTRALSDEDIAIIKSGIPYSGNGSGAINRIWSKIEKARKPYLKPITANSPSRVLGLIDQVSNPENFDLARESNFTIFRVNKNKEIIATRSPGTVLRVGKKMDVSQEAEEYVPTIYIAKTGREGSYVNDKEAVSGKLAIFTENGAQIATETFKNEKEALAYVRSNYNDLISHIKKHDIHNREFYEGAAAGESGRVLPLSQIYTSPITREKAKKALVESFKIGQLSDELEAEAISISTAIDKYPDDEIHRILGTKKVKKDEEASRVLKRALELRLTPQGKRNRKDITGTYLPAAIGASMLPFATMLPRHKLPSKEDIDRERAIHSNLVTNVLPSYFEDEDTINRNLELLSLLNYLPINMGEFGGNA